VKTGFLPHSSWGDPDSLLSDGLIVYLNYIGGLDQLTDERLNDIINERTKFVGIGKIDYADAVNEIFDAIDEQAKKLEEEEIADESVKLAEDAAAVAAFWSFGFSMVAYAGLAATSVALETNIKAKEKDLRKLQGSADDDIAGKIGTLSPRNTCAGAHSFFVQTRK
jgi:hypothetical protein